MPVAWEMEEFGNGPVSVRVPTSSTRYYVITTILVDSGDSSLYASLLAPS
jgi:hypothetical protein